MRVRDLAAGAAVRDSELDDIVAILVQARSAGDRPAGGPEERAAGLSLGPDFFQVAARPVAVDPTARRRATSAARLACENTLRARIRQDARPGGLRCGVTGQPRRRPLPRLRDDLVEVIAAAGTSSEQP